MSEEIEVLGFNAGYFLGYDGKFEKFLKKPHKGIIGSEKDERENIEKFLDTVEEIDPDIIGLVEVDRGSIRTFTDGQVDYIQEELENRGMDYERDIGFKYRDESLLRYTPILRHMSNGVLYKKGKVKRHHLSRGWKRLLLEVEMENFSFFVSHMPLTFFSRTKRRQLQQISDILNSTEDFIIFGDFNVGNPYRLNIFRVVNGGEIQSPGYTYPVAHPSKRYDMFVSDHGDFEVVDCEKLDLEISDHFAVKATYRFGNKEKETGESEEVNLK